jgi:hypothetical protein
MRPLYMYDPDPIARQLQLQDGRRKYTLASLVDSSHLAGLVPGEGVLIETVTRLPATSFTHKLVASVCDCLFPSRTQIILYLVDSLSTTLYRRSPFRRQG